MSQNNLSQEIEDFHQEVEEMTLMLNERETKLAENAVRIE